MEDLTIYLNEQRQLVTKEQTMEDISLLPVDMGIDLKALKLPVFFCDTVVSATYLSEYGEERSVAGTNEEVKEALEAAGYKLFLGSLPFNCTE